jgi:hypothetical protein
MGRMKLKGQVGRDIYRAGKPMSTTGAVLKSRVRLILLRVHLVMKFEILKMPFQLSLVTQNPN